MGERLTVLLSRMQSGEQAACDAVFAVVYPEPRQLEKADARAAQMVQMRYFGGYSDKEIAESLDVTERTVQRDWEKAKVLLQVMLRSA